MFRCPHCNASGLVKQTRVEGRYTRRRYHCTRCKGRFSTVEYAVDDQTKTPAGQLPPPFTTETAPT